MDKYTLNPAVPGAIDNIVIGALKPVHGSFSGISHAHADGTVSMIGRVRPFTVAAGAARSFAMQESDELTVTGADGTTGTVQRLDANDAPIGVPIAVGVGANAPIGPFAETQKFVITCTAGSIGATVRDVALRAASLARSAAGAFMGIQDGGGNKLPIPYGLYSSAVPVGIAPSGIINASGVVTFDTALAKTYADGIWLRFPVGAVIGGVAGLYFVVMSSTTVGQVKTNFIDPAAPFTPSIPASQINAVGSGAAYVPTTNTDITLLNVTLPGGSPGPNGQYRITVLGANNNSAGSKVYSQRVGIDILHSRSRSTTIVEGWYGTLRNRGVANRQLTMLNTYTTEPASTGSAPYIYKSYDTSADQSLTTIANVASPLDWIIYEAMNIEVVPS